MKSERAFASYRARRRSMSNEVRRLSHGLHPSVIEDFGLSTALEEFCEEFANAQGIDVRFDGPAADTGLSADGASCLYRIAQECLQNAAKHARRDGGSRRTHDRRCERSTRGDGQRSRISRRSEPREFGPRPHQYEGADHDGERNALHYFSTGTRHGNRRLCSTVRSLA